MKKITIAFMLLIVTVFTACKNSNISKNKKKLMRCQYWHYKKDKRGKIHLRDASRNNQWYSGHCPKCGM